MFLCMWLIFNVKYLQFADINANGYGNYFLSVWELQSSLHEIIAF